VSAFAVVGVHFEICFYDWNCQPWNIRSVHSVVVVVVWCIHVHVVVVHDVGVVIVVCVLLSCCMKVESKNKKSSEIGSV